MLLKKTYIGFYVCYFISKVVCQELIESFPNVHGSNDYEDYDYEGVICTAEQFKCRQREICIPLTRRCNGISLDCPDNSDEENCTKNTTTASVDLTSEDSIHLIYPCNEEQFDCDGKVCIMKTKLCDGTQDCPNGKDEQQCPSRNIDSRTLYTTAMSEYDGCDDDDFSCGEQCLPKHAICDGVKDCEDGIDELDCPAPDYNDSCHPEDDFECSTGECISIRTKCDGFIDCSNGTDEEDCDKPKSGGQINDLAITRPQIAQFPETTRQFSSSEPRSSARPILAKLTCLYENTHYPADTTIHDSNCIEVRCSSSGRLLVWNNQHPTCNGVTTCPTLSLMCMCLILISTLRLL